LLINPGEKLQLDGFLQQVGTQIAIPDVSQGRDANLQFRYPNHKPTLHFEWDGQNRVVGGRIVLKGARGSTSHQGKHQKMSKNVSAKFRKVYFELKEGVGPSFQLQSFKVWKLLVTPNRV
jgi:hypothetical protein